MPAYSRTKMTKPLKLKAGAWTTLTWDTVAAGDAGAKGEAYVQIAPSTFTATLTAKITATGAPALTRLVEREKTGAGWVNGDEYPPVEHPLSAGTTFVADTRVEKIPEGRRLIAQVQIPDGGTVEAAEARRLLLLAPPPRRDREPRLLLQRKRRLSGPPVLRRRCPDAPGGQRLPGGRPAPARVGLLPGHLLRRQGRVRGRLPDLDRRPRRLVDRQGMRPARGGRHVGPVDHVRRASTTTPAPSPPSPPTPRHPATPSSSRGSTRTWPRSWTPSLVPVVGADANMDIDTFAKALGPGMTAYGKQSGICLVTALPLTDVEQDHYGEDQGWTDHPSVGGTLP